MYVNAETTKQLLKATSFPETFLAYGLVCLLFQLNLHSLLPFPPLNKALAMDCTCVLDLQLSSKEVVQLVMA